MDQQLLQRQGSVRFSDYQSARRHAQYKKSQDQLTGELVVNFLIIATLTIFVLVDRHESCNKPILTWLIVVIGYYIVDFIMAMFQLNFLERNRRENLCIVILRFLLSAFLVSWLIYGNVLLYDKNSDCRQKATGLNLIMMLIIIYGYLEMLKCCCIGTCFCIMLPILIFAQRRAQRPNWVPAAPQFLNNLARTRFNRTNMQGSDTCAICLTEYQETDEVIPLPCDHRHYFHSKCIENWLKNNNKCPLCQKEITMEALNQQRQQMSQRRQ